MKRLATITLALTIGLAGTAHAAAGDDARLVFIETGFVPPATVVNAPVPCATNEVALGGGIRRSPSAQPVVIQETGPQAANGSSLSTGQRPRRWFSSARHEGNPGDPGVTFATYAVCSASSDVTVQTTTLSVGASQGGVRQGSATMPCPNGQRALGGGILGAGRLEASGPVDETFSPLTTVDGDIPHGWFVSIATFSSMPPTYQVYALCSPTSTATIAIDSETLQPNETAALGVGCPSTRRLLSGGVIGSIPRGEVLGSGPAQNNGLVYAGQDTNNTPTTGYGWRTEVFNIGAEAGYKVAAVCEAPSAAPTPPTNPTNPTNPTQPSNDFTIGKLTKNRDKGTATLALTVPGPGTVAVESPKLKEQSAPVAAAGEVSVKLKADGNAKQKLKDKGKLKAAAEISFTPTGGVESAQETRVKLVREG